MTRNLENINARIIDPQNKFTDNVAKSGAKVTYIPADGLLTVEYPPASPPSDISTLRGGHPTGIKAKRNNRSEVYSILFNLNSQTLAAFGKKEIRTEVLTCLDSIWEDHLSRLPQS